MEPYLPLSNEYLVYPGEYIPMPETEALLRELKTTDHALKPLVNMDELKDCYRVKVAIPGARREDIFIEIDKNILTIVVLQHDPNGYRKESKIHEFESGILERHIMLPQNADSVFVNAEYKEGMLDIYIPKSENPVKNLTARVVVY